MFFAEGQIRVRLYGQPADMRKSYDGLQALTRHAMGRDPLDGSLYIYVNRRGNQIKCLYFDRSGFCIWGKRLEAGRFIGDWGRVRTHEMDWTGLKLLIEGLEGKRVRKRFALPDTLSSPTNAGTMSAVQLHERVSRQAERIAALEHQLDWFRRQVFGQKRERFVADPNPAQLHLGEVLPVPDASSGASADRQQIIPAHTRRIKAKNGADAETGEELPFFDESKVPVQTIVLMPDTVQGLSPEQHEIIGEKVTYRMAQRPGSVQVLTNQYTDCYT